MHTLPSTLLHILYTLCLLGSVGSGLWAQTDTLRGQVRSPGGEPLFAVNLYWQRHPDQGTVTDLNGGFALPVPADADSLTVRYPGYDLLTLGPTDWRAQPLRITLRRKELTLGEVEIAGRSSVAEQFSVRKLSQLEIYLSPVAAADPLRAIAALPASTNADESANPVLRGSAADLSQVIVNGVPVYQPVRNGQLNGIGNFSLFNTALLESQEVYASNPPLLYGNASAGLVSLSTTQRAPQAATSLSVTLASLGLFRSQPLGDQGAFVQVYGNWQFAGPFLALHPQSLALLRDFGNVDAGAHLYLPLNDRWSWRSLSYGIDEQFEVQTQSLAYQGIATGDSRRFFTLHSLERQGQRNWLAIRMGQNASQSQFAFGALGSRRQRHQQYYGVDFRRYFSDKLQWQRGISLDLWREQRQDTLPETFFALDPGVPRFFRDTALQRPLLEYYSYLKWDPHPNWHLAAGYRSNVRLGAVPVHFSGQVSARHDLSRRQSLLLSAGRYHSYLPPAAQLPQFSRIRSHQVALDYQYRGSRTELDLAFFHKQEQGRQPNGVFVAEEQQVSGLELAWRQELGQFVSWELANTWLRQRFRISDEAPAWRGVQDFPYFLKAALSFRHPDWFTASLNLIARPGQVFTPIEGGQFRPDLGLYEPQFATIVNDERLPDYRNLSLALSRYFTLRQGSLVAFVNVNNLLNRANPMEPWYNQDFTQTDFALYSLRTVFFGVVWEWQGKG